MHEFKMKVEKYDNRVINKDYNTDFLVHPTFRVIVVN